MVGNVVRDGFVVRALVIKCAGLANRRDETKAHATIGIQTFGCLDTLTAAGGLDNSVTTQEETRAALERVLSWLDNVSRTVLTCTVALFFNVARTVNGTTRNGIRLDGRQRDTAYSAVALLGNVADAGGITADFSVGLHHIDTVSAVVALIRGVTITHWVIATQGA